MHSTMTQETAGRLVAPSHQPSLAEVGQPPLPAMALRGLSKRFGDKVAVNEVTLTVPVGSFYGLVGPNGAGKTTTISMAVGLLRPDTGTSRIFGVDVWKDPLEAKALVGVMPDGMVMPERLTGRELLTYLGELRGLGTESVRTRVNDLIDVLGLHGAEQTLIAEYSAGMRKKIVLATALLHAPSLLILDEPLEAVDPVSAATIKLILQRFVDSGGSVVLSSHVMALVEQMCDHVAIIDKGTVAAAGPLDEVRGNRSLESAFVELVSGRPVDAIDLAWLDAGPDPVHEPAP
ncbi:MAG: ABC transporter ATP-binding protein [Thermomicrobiales bacterium]